MDDQRTPHLIKYLPLVAVTTVWVAVIPPVAVWVLRDAGVIDSAVLAVALAAALALGASYLGGRIWETRSAAGDLLFSDLTLWGWARRWWAERQISSAVKLLDGVAGTEGLSRERRERLLATLATALESRDPHTHGHSRRVARHAVMIAKTMGLSRREIAKVRTAATLHDVGKLETPQAILRKPSRLSDLEYRIIQQHSSRGAELVSILGDEKLTAIVRHHHERIDGTGYPDGLAGDEIPVGARIIAVADTFDAVTSTRPYRPARPHKTALEILAGEAGTQLDPAAVRAFRSYYSGRRPLAIWAVVASLPQKIFASAASSANTVAGSVASVMATSAVASAVAVGAVTSPLVSDPGLAAAAKNTSPSATSASIQASHRATTSLPATSPARALAGDELAEVARDFLARATHTKNELSGASTAGTAEVASLGAMQTVQATDRGGTSGRAAAGASIVATPAGPANATPQAGGSNAAHANPTARAQGKGAPAAPAGARQRRGAAGRHAPTNASKGHSKGSGRSQGSGHSQSSSGSSAQQGSGPAGSQGQGAGSGQGEHNGNGQGSAGSQGTGNGQGNGNGQGSAGSQGNGTANGQGDGNASAQGSANAQSQGNGNGQAQVSPQGKSADQAAPQN